MNDILVQTGKLAIIERLRDSKSGTPRYWVLINDYSYKTKPGAEYNHAIPGLAGSTITVTIGRHDGRPTISNILEANS